MQTENFKIKNCAGPIMNNKSFFSQIFLLIYLQKQFLQFFLFLLVVFQGFVMNFN